MNNKILLFIGGGINTLPLKLINNISKFIYIDINPSNNFEFKKNYINIIVETFNNLGYIPIAQKHLFCFIKKLNKRPGYINFIHSKTGIQLDYYYNTNINKINFFLKKKLYNEFKNVNILITSFNLSKDFLKLINFKEFYALDNVDYSSTDKNLMFYYLYSNHEIDYFIIKNNEIIKCSSFLDINNKIKNV